MKKPLNQYPLIFQRGSSPWGSRSPAILAIDSDGKLLPIAMVQLIEHEMLMRLLDPKFDQLRKDSFIIRTNRRWDNASS